MAEPDRTPEGWRVPQRPAFAAAVLVPLVLAAGVWGASRFYEARLKPLRHPPTLFPAPGVETFVHDGQADPRRLPPGHPPDAAVAAAKRNVVRTGIEGWSAPR